MCPVATVLFSTVIEGLLFFPLLFPLQTWPESPDPMWTWYDTEWWHFNLSLTRPGTAASFFEFSRFRWAINRTMRGELRFVSVHTVWSRQYYSFLIEASWSIGKFCSPSTLYLPYPAFRRISDHGRLHFCTRVKNWSALGLYYGLPTLTSTRPNTPLRLYTVWRSSLLVSQLIFMLFCISSRIFTYNFSGIRPAIVTSNNSYRLHHRGAILYL